MGSAPEVPTHKRQRSETPTGAPGLSRSLTTPEPDTMVQRAREIMQHGPRALSMRRSQSIAEDDVFRVPSLPSSRAKEKEDVPDIVRELEKANKAVSY
jgi:hypothetical protein